ncbi:hypothetical protein Tco_1115821, partial [Tanacetum coccineum]
MTSKAQQVELDNALVALENRRLIGKCNMRINPGIKPKEPTFQVALDALALTTCYPAFLITAEVPKNLDFVALIWEDLAYQIDNMDSKKQDKINDESSPAGLYSAILSEESPSKKKSAKAKKVAATKPKPTKKKAPVKADRGKGLNVLSEVALSEATQLKKATKRSKKDFHISHASGSGKGTDFESWVPDKQHRKTSGDSEEEDKDDENDSEDENDNGDNDDDGNDGNGDDDDANDDDNQKDDDTNNDDEETDSDRNELDIFKIPVLNQSSTEYYEEEEEKIDDEETMDEEEDDEVTKELYNDVNMNLGNKDA